MEHNVLEQTSNKYNTTMTNRLNLKIIIQNWDQKLGLHYLTYFEAKENCLLAKGDMKIR